MHTKNVETIQKAQEEIFNKVKSQADTLAKIKAMPYPLIVKWQMLLSVLLPIQVETIKNYGFTNEQTALLEYSSQLMHFQEMDSHLRSVGDSKWSYIFEHAFGLPTVQKVTQAQAAALMNDISNEMVSDEFLAQVDQHMGKLDPKLPLQEKRQALLGILLPLQLAVMAKHGFTGEEGYVQAQKALMDYMHDPQMMEKATKAQLTLFTRAGVMG